MTWLDLGGQMPKVKVTAGSRGDEGIHLLFQLENAVYWLKSEIEPWKPVLLWCIAGKFKR